MIAAALCIAVGARIVAVPAHSFTLEWRHTIEKVRWEEDYLIAGEWLLLTRARIRGSGAGMDPPPDAVRDGTAWSYRPADRWRKSVVLARSEIGDDYRLCIKGECRPFDEFMPARGVTTLAACTKANQ